MTQTHTTPGATSLVIWAGRLLVTIAVLHTVVSVALSRQNWGALASGALWLQQASTLEDYRQMATFWAVVGSFALPMALLGLVLIRLARRGVPLPGYLGWALLGWVSLALALLGPSGFLLGTVPAVMLILAYRRQTRHLAQA
ncbi:MAG: DUF6463 family protein [Micromonosporaceae bacterium]